MKQSIKPFLANKHRVWHSWRLKLLGIVLIGALLAATAVATAQTRTYSFSLTWGSFGAEEGQFNQPYDVAVDDDGYVYVTDTYNNRVEKFTGDGKF